MAKWKTMKIDQASGVVTGAIDHAADAPPMNDAEPIAADAPPMNDAEPIPDCARRFERGRFLFPGKVMVDGVLYPARVYQCIVCADKSDAAQYRYLLYTNRWKGYADVFDVGDVLPDFDRTKKRRLHCFSDFCVGDKVLVTYPEGEFGGEITRVVQNKIKVRFHQDGTSAELSSAHAHLVKKAAAVQVN